MSDMGWSSKSQRYLSNYMIKRTPACCTKTYLNGNFPCSFEIPYTVSTAKYSLHLAFSQNMSESAFRQSYTNTWK